MVRAVSLGVALLTVAPLVISLLLVGGTGWSTAIDLVANGAKARMASLVVRTRAYVEPAQRAAEQLHDAIQSGRLDPRDDAAVERALRLVLGTTPQLQSLIVLDFAGTTNFVHFARPGEIMHHRVDWHDDPIIQLALRQGATDGGFINGWYRPYWVPELNGTVLTFIQPSSNPQGWRGLVVATVALARLSSFVIEAAGPDVHPFILLGRDRVIASEMLAHGMVTLSEAEPLPALDKAGDPRLAQIWAPGWEERRIERIPGAHSSPEGNDALIYLTESWRPFGSEEPWLIGIYTAGATAMRDLWKLALASLVGLAAALVASLLALLLARQISRPVAALAANARALTALDLEHARPLARSRIVEIDDAAVAMNRMVGALRVFARYVPRRLVERLLADGLEQRPSIEREVTVLFCDIVGFTAFAESRTPAETAAALNAHFAALARAIEAEAGTIDKYMGDALMAFWNAPDRQPDHAARAVRAAAAIAARHDPDGFRMRIGIHTGRALVGDLGAPSRLNYTIVGDTVNTAQRLEQLGRVLRPDDAVAVLVSEATVRALASGTVPLASLGLRRVRGRAQPIEVFALGAAVPARANGLEVPA